MAEGTLRLRDARIEGALILQGTHWSKPHITEQRNASRNNLLLAQGLSVLGDVNLTDAQFDGGGLNFRLARLTTFDAAGARIDNRTGEYALNMNGAVIQGNLRLCDGFNSAGLVRIDRAQITGMLTLERAELEAPGRLGSTLTAYEAIVAAGLRLLWSHVEGHVNLSGVRTSRFTDDPEKWPDSFSLSGMQYTELGDEAAPKGGSDVEKRLKWLGRQDPFDIGPYQELASVYGRYGHRRQAQKILIAGRNRGRRTDVDTAEGPTRLIRRLARWLIAPFELATGHGYRPQRAATVLALLIATAFLMVSIPSNQLLLRTSDEDGHVYTPYGALAGQQDGPCGQGKVRCFQPAAFAVETVLPLISFSQTSTWYVGVESTQGRILRAMLSILTALGWLVSSIFVLSFARVLRD